MREQEREHERDSEGELELEGTRQLRRMRASATDGQSEIVIESEGASESAFASATWVIMSG